MSLDPQKPKPGVPNVRAVAIEFVRAAAQKIEHTDIWDALALRYPGLPEAAIAEYVGQIAHDALHATVLISWPGEVPERDASEVMSPEEEAALIEVIEGGHDPADYVEVEKPVVPPSGWAETDPVEEIRPGGIYLTVTGEILFGVGNEDARYLVHLDGRRSLWPEVGELRAAGWLAANLAEALEMERDLTALTGTRRVAKHAIVLDPPTARTIPINVGEYLKVLVGADVEIEHTDTDGFETGLFLTPAMARQLAGLLAQAADAVEADGP